MTRVLITLLMLLQVLACRFLDCGECRGMCVASCDERNDVCDDCCCKSELAERHSNSDPCDDPACPDNSGPLDCFCAGALQAHVVECPDLLADGEVFAPPYDVPYSTPLVVTTSSGLAVDGCPHFPPLITGMSVCALTQTYLL